MNVTFAKKAIFFSKQIDFPQDQVEKCTIFYYGQGQEIGP